MAVNPWSATVSEEIIQAKCAAFAAEGVTLDDVQKAWATINSNMQSELENYLAQFTDKMDGYNVLYDEIIFDLNSYIDLLNMAATEGVTTSPGANSVGYTIAKQISVADGLLLQITQRKFSFSGTDQRLIQNAFKENNFFDQIEMDPPSDPFLELKTQFDEKTTNLNSLYTTYFKYVDAAETYGAMALDASVALSISGKLLDLRDILDYEGSVKILDALSDTIMDLVYARTCEQRALQADLDLAQLVAGYGVPAMNLALGTLSLFNPALAAAAGAFLSSKLQAAFASNAAWS